MIDNNASRARLMVITFSYRDNAIVLEVFCKLPGGEWCWQRIQRERAGMRYMISVEYLGKVFTRKVQAMRRTFEKETNVPGSGPGTASTVLFASMTIGGRYRGLWVTKSHQGVFGAATCCLVLSLGSISVMYCTAIIRRMREGSTGTQVGHLTQCVSQ